MQSTLLSVVVQLTDGSRSIISRNTGNISRACNTYFCSRSLLLFPCFSTIPLEDQKQNTEYSSKSAAISVTSEFGYNHKSSITGFQYTKILKRSEAAAAWISPSN